MFCSRSLSIHLLRGLGGAVLIVLALMSGSERVELISGKPADITPGLYKLLWLRDHEPDTMAPA